MFYLTTYYLLLTNNMSVVYIGIGSNLNSREENCIRSVRLLRDCGLTIIKESSLYKTEAWGVTDQPYFINMAVKAETSMEPDELLGALKAIEQQMGRKDAGKWGPRIIDLDILLYAGLIIRTPELCIPHPLMHQREFVLRPLSEIAPDILHPLLKKTISALLSEIRP